jgi:DNA-binding HxlR family transcriptional regulator
MARKAEKNLPGRARPSVAGMVEDIVGCKWSMTVLALVESGVHRPGAMERAVDGLSAKVLNERLRKLTRFGILDKLVFPEVPPRVEYRLTDFGREFSILIGEVRRLQSRLDGAG